MSTTSQDNNKRIAKNTLLLYFRMIVLMVVSLYTSRVILDALGVDDYGIYNVVGGVVATFAVVSNALSSAISRFITYELGKGNSTRLNRIFSASITIQLLLAIIVAVVMETIGIWFLNTQMAIPSSRSTAANWTLQLSIVTFVINLISVPYNATIIAHERMSAFAYISIIEGLGKLLVAYLIMASPFDRLVLYAILMCVVAASVRFIYGNYCTRHFEECHYHFVYDKDLLKQMFGFAGWNFFGTCAYTLNTQGVNLLINIFFGVKLNAARAIATQADVALRQFINSFTTAVNPQITKSYAQGDNDYLYSLVCRSAKFSSFLLLFFAIPLSLEAQTIFSIWLKEVPEYTIIFFRLSVLIAFIDGAMVNSLMTAIFATANIRKYQVMVSSVGITVFPITWALYLLGYPAWTTYLTYFFVYIGALYVRLYCVRKLTAMQIKMYIKEVVLRVIPVALFSILPPYLLCHYMNDGILRLCLVCLLSVVTTALVVITLGLSASERNLITTKIRHKWHH